MLAGVMEAPAFSFALFDLVVIDFPFETMNKSDCPWAWDTIDGDTPDEKQQTMKRTLLSCAEVKSI